MVTNKLASCLGLVASLTTFASPASAQTSLDDDGLIIISGTGGDIFSQPASVTGGSYTTYSTQITFSDELYAPSGSIISDNGTVSTSRVPITQNQDYTVIEGRETSTLSGNFSASATSAAPTEQVTNTRPCNNYVEFCDRKWSNITYIGCHNSPFVRPGNAGSNQEYEVTYQLNDGVRFLQAQIQFPANGTEPHFCHTSCDMLDAGPITDWLTTVREWVQRHPFDVVTILLGNGNYSSPDLYAPYIEASGITQYLYEPPYLPMNLDDWPTLAEMIIRGKRVIMFMDYNADQRKYPWLLDQFSQMWETPFNPQDRDFPCTVQRPPDLGDEAARNRLYLFNHNLNADFNLFGSSVLVPAVSLLNETNNVTGYGSLGESTEGCVEDWGRAPNFLNVDYYNYGYQPGSVFEVAAKFNNVTYDMPCCGPDSAGPLSRPITSSALLLTAVAALFVLS